MESLRVAIEAVVAGDTSRLSNVLTASHSDLQAAAEGLTLSVSRAALVRVMGDWRDGRCAADEVQQWASFVRRGYAAQDGDPILPINIDYDAEAEDLIAHVTSRFDEIGDLVDGRIDEAEQGQILRALQDQQPISDIW